MPFGRKPRTTLESSSCSLKAKNNIGEQQLFSKYSWTDGVLSVIRHTEKGEQQIENGKSSDAIFFDYVDYPIWVEFEDYVMDAQFGSDLQGDNERFTFRRHILAGFSDAIFFDYVDYPIWVEFEDYVMDAQFGSDLQGDNERFTFRRHILAGFLNYGNEIGRSEIHLIYKTKEGLRTFTFSLRLCNGCPVWF